MRANTRAGVCIVLGLTAALAAPAQADYLATLEVETQVLDLETGMVAARDPAQPQSFAADLHVAYNADRLNPLVVFQSQVSGVAVAFLDEMVFDYVNAATIATEEFTTDLVDLPFDSTDTLVLITAEGGIFKIGNAVDNGDGTISFDVGLID